MVRCKWREILHSGAPPAAFGGSAPEHQVFDVVDVVLAILAGALLLSLGAAFTSAVA